MKKWIAFCFLSINVWVTNWSSKQSSAFQSWCFFQHSFVKPTCVAKYHSIKNYSDNLGKWSNINLQNCYIMILLSTGKSSLNNIEYDLMNAKLIGEMAYAWLMMMGYPLSTPFKQFNVSLPTAVQLLICEYMLILNFHWDKYQAAI